MKKSVYSLVLSDEVVQCVDRAAYSAGLSRSAMINQILAEYVSYMTPEQRIKQVFRQMEDMLSPLPDFQIMLQPAGSMMSLRSALSYKYNPTVKYSVELYHDNQQAQGQLKVSLRSQSSSLILYMSQFWKLWVKIETAYTGGVDCLIEDGRFIRTLRGDVTSQQLGEAISEYIKALDSAMKAFFSSLDKPAQAMRQVENIYLSQIHDRGISI